MRIFKLIYLFQMLSNLAYKVSWKAITLFNLSINEASLYLILEWKNHYFG